MYEYILLSKIGRSLPWTWYHLPCSEYNNKIHVLAFDRKVGLNGAQTRHFLCRLPIGISQKEVSPKSNESFDAFTSARVSRQMQRREPVFRLAVHITSLVQQELEDSKVTANGCNMCGCVTVCNIAVVQSRAQRRSVGFLQLLQVVAYYVHPPPVTQRMECVPVTHPLLHQFFIDLRISHDQNSLKHGA